MRKGIDVTGAEHACTHERWGSTLLGAAFLASFMHLLAEGSPRYRAFVRRLSLAGDWRGGLGDQIERVGAVVAVAFKGENSDVGPTFIDRAPSFLDLPIADVTVSDVRRYRNATFEQAIVERVRFVRCDLSHTRWANARLQDVEFASCRMDHAWMESLRGEGVTFRECRMSAPRNTLVAEFSGREGARLPKALVRARFQRCVLAGFEFAGYHLPAARFEDCDLRDVDMSGADLTGAVFHRCVLDGARFTDADLTETVFTGCDLTGVIGGAVGG